MKRAGERCSRQKEQYIQRPQGKNKLGLSEGKKSGLLWLNHSECEKKIVPSSTQRGRQTADLLQF